MKKWVGIVFVLLVAIGGWYWLALNRQLISPFLKKAEKTEMPLDKYDFDNLRKRQGIASEIKMLGSIPEIETRRKQPKEFNTNKFSFESNGKKITGMVNYYGDSKIHPVIVMIRGYADKEGYYTGFGSYRVADELAKAGYATVSIDFLGYADSDAEAIDPLEARFEKVEGVMDLIESVKQLPWVDKNRIGIWAHSNGGQIALSLLEVTGQRYPTVLWAPMTNPFPQSLIDTTDNEIDRQKAVDYVNIFLKKYDGRRYAFENYYDWINAPIQIEQGTNDAWVKVEWQQRVVDKLKSLGKPVMLNIYSRDDHNLSKNWGEVVAKDIEFYGQNMR